jgi:hypothetical protein
LWEPLIPAANDFTGVFAVPNGPGKFIQLESSVLRFYMRLGTRTAISPAQHSTNMKTSLMILASLSSLALVLALAFSGDAFAELAGLHVPAVLNVENTLALFTATFALLLLIAEYRPRLSPLAVRSGQSLETGAAVLSSPTTSPTS